MKILLLWIFLWAQVGFAAEPARFSAPIILEGKNQGDVWVIPGNALQLESASLLKVLGPLLIAPVRKDFEASLKGVEKVSLVALAKQEIEIAFDESSLSLVLTLKDSLRARRELNLSRERPISLNSVGPSVFSGYLNATATQGFSYPRSASRLPFRGNLSLASSLKGYVLESGSSYTEGDSFEWKREDTRFSRDFESSLIRATVGDIQVFTSGYQNARALGGISISRQFSIQPYLNIRPLNRTEVLIRRPSVIEVYVNDAFVNRLSVAPGPLQLTDFPLFSGINKVDLKITDENAKVEWVNLNLLYDSQLLGEGIQQFSYQLGVPSQQLRNDRRYDDRDLNVSFYHRFGLSDRFTLGGSFQADRKLAMLGQDFVLLTRGGLISTDAGLSRRTGGLTSAAGRARFRSLDYKLGLDKPIRGAAEIEYKAKSFAAIGQADSPNEFSWRYDLSLSRPLSPGSNLGIGAGFLKNRVGAPDRKTARLDFSSELGREWRTTMSYAVERESRIGHRFQILLSWIQADGKFFGNLSYDYPSKTTRLQASRNPSTVVDDLRATVGLERSPANSQADMLLEYTHEKAQLRADHVSARENSGSHNTAHTTTLTASSAVAWAGGNVAWSRPITDSFVLVSARPLFRKFPLAVNKVDGSAEATVNHVGAAVLPNLTSYNEIPVVIDNSTLPMGYSLGQDHFVVRPTYRSGVKLEVGGDSSVVVSGQLLTPDRSPLSLATGRVMKSGMEVSAFFTNRTGIFVLENLPPGEYQLTLDGQEFGPMRLRIDETQAGFIKLPPHILQKGAAR